MEGEPLGSMNFSYSGKEKSGKKPYFGDPPKVGAWLLRKRRAWGQGVGTSVLAFPLCGVFWAPAWEGQRKGHKEM